jgi:hypothetical protein
MAGRSAEELKRELESERERLGDAVRALRLQADRMRRRLPALAIGAAGASLLLRGAARRLRGRKAARSEKRPRFRFGDPD